MVSGGMTKLRDKLRDDPEIQKLYTYQKGAGLKPGSSGKNVFCDTMVSRDLSAKCNDHNYQNSPF